MPDLHYLTEKRISSIRIEYEEILSLIRNLNPNKAAGPDRISGQMLILCDVSVVKPLKIIFEICLKHLSTQSLEKKQMLLLFLRRTISNY